MSTMASVDQSIPAVCLEDPYEFEEWLAQLPDSDRGPVALGVLASLGHGNLRRWKEHHAFSIGLGRSLYEFPPGSYAFYFMPIDSTLPAEPLPEDLEPPELEVLGEAAGLDDEEMAEMDGEELSEYIADHFSPELLDGDSDGCYKLAEAASLHDLLRTMAERGLLGIDPDPWLTDESPWPKGSGEPPLSAIRDRHLRRIASSLSGDGWHMFRTDDDQEASQSAIKSCRRPLLRRPDREFIIGWFSLPPAEIGDACILCLPSTDESAAPAN